MSHIPDVPEAERKCDNCGMPHTMCPGCTGHRWEESWESFRARVEKIIEDLTRERDEARAALGALWDADAGPRDVLIDTAEERLCKDDQRLRDAWLAARKVLGRGD